MIDVGTSVSSEHFITAVREHDARLVGINALLTTTTVSIGKPRHPDPGGRPGRCQGNRWAACRCPEFAASMGVDRMLTGSFRRSLGSIEIPRYLKRPPS